MQLYCKEFDMEVNVHTSVVGFHGLREEVVLRLEESFPLKSLNFMGGFKYLGFILKTNGYMKNNRE